MKVTQNHCIFMGTPNIAATVLENMIKAAIQIDLVVTQPDKKVGRKQKIQFSPVKEVALKYGIEVFQPRKLKEDYQRILDQNADVIVTCAYGQLVPDIVLEAPRYGCVNLHGSILPKYRGGAPIQRAIWNGDKTSGMSLMKMVTGLDEGPVLMVDEFSIVGETSSSLFEKMADSASRLIIDNFDTVCSDAACYVEQDCTKATYAPIIKKEEERLDLSKSDQEILCQIRALSAQPGAYVFVGKKKFKIIEADYVATQVDRSFTFVGFENQAFLLALNEGILQIHMCQMEGKPIMDAKSFYNGQGRNLVGTAIE